MQKEHTDTQLCTCDFFSLAWWERFAFLWNSSEHKACLSGLGDTLIEVSDRFVEVALFWGRTGDLTVSAAGLPATLRLVATSENWNAFVRGDFSPLDGVLRGRIRIDGDAKRLISYIEDITKMCCVARLMT